MRRSTFTVSSVAAVLCAQAPGFADAGMAMRERLRALERRSGGRLGVYAFALDGAAAFGHREHERFPMCSTFKALLVSAVLARVDRGVERLERECATAKAICCRTRP